jgi:hypothetical protein
MITELDVIDNEFPGDQALRDKLVAQKTRELVDCVFDEPTGIVTWAFPINILGFRSTISDRTACRIGIAAGPGHAG